MPRRAKPTKVANGRGSIYQDSKSGTWRAQVTLADGSRRSVSAPTQAEAVERANDLLARAATGELPASTKTTVGDVLAHWRDYVLPARRLAPATVEQYTWCLGIIETHLARAKLTALRVEHVERFLADRAAEGYSRNSVRLLRTTLGQVLGEAERRGDVPRNVARLAHLPADAAEPAARRSLTADEAQRLLLAAEGDRLAAFWTLALATGARRGELLGLAWDDVDLEAGTMTIRQALRRSGARGFEIGPTKTSGSVRTVRLGPSAVSALRAHRTRQRRERLAAGDRWRESGLVFTTNTGTYVDPNNLRHRWDALSDKAGLRGVVLHELRHTAGSQAVEGGVALTIVADQLGHADVNMLARTYRHRVAPVVEGVDGVMEAFMAPKRRQRASRKPQAVDESAQDD